MNSRNWSAEQKSVDFSGSEHQLSVTGEVELPSTSHVAQLDETVPVDFNPTILSLDLIVHQHGIGADVMTWRTVTFNKRPVSQGQFTQVIVKLDGQELTSMPVAVVHS